MDDPAGRPVSVQLLRPTRPVAAVARVGVAPHLIPTPDAPEQTVD
ncbi:MAG TPA: hypothetical protein VFN78_01755 [Ktedonobacterales bacterium]|nr:hypothetical protein [Ktedonobacterales bacterium]